MAIERYRLGTEFRCDFCFLIMVGRSRPLWVWSDGRWYLSHTGCAGDAIRFGYYLEASWIDIEPPPVELGRLLESRKQFDDNYVVMVVNGVCDAKPTSLEETIQLIEASYLWDSWSGMNQPFSEERLAEIKDRAIELAEQAWRQPCS